MQCTPLQDFPCNDAYLCRIFHVIHTSAGFSSSQLHMQSFSVCSKVFLMQEGTLCIQTQSLLRAVPNFKRLHFFPSCNPFVSITSSNLKYGQLQSSFLPLSATLMHFSTEILMHLIAGCRSRPHWEHYIIYSTSTVAIFSNEKKILNSKKTWS